MAAGYQTQVLVVNILLVEHLPQPLSLVFHGLLSYISAPYKSDFNTTHLAFSQDLAIKCPVRIWKIVFRLVLQVLDWVLTAELKITYDILRRLMCL